MLASVLAGLVFVAVVEYCDPAFSKVAMAEIVAALKGPLDLFAERSPGGRGARALLSIKSIKGPHERVLSTVRERPHVIPPGPDTPIFAASAAVASIPMIPPQYDTQPVDRFFGPPPLAFFPGIPQGLVPGSPPSAPVIPPTGPDVPPIVVGPPPPPETPVPPDTPVPPSVPETPPPVTIVLPEPATWAMMILGLFAIGLRRRVHK